MQSALSELADRVDGVLDEIYSSIDFTMRSRGVEAKSSQGDLVTELDKELEMVVGRRLRALLAGSCVMGEEMGGDLGDGPTWIVDPIDGTTNVVHGIRHAAVTVALWQGGRPVLGIIRDIFQGTRYIAIEGSGAFKLSGSMSYPVAVSTTGSLSAALISFGLPYDRDQSDVVFTVAARAFSSCQDLRRRGSAALDIVGVAEGSLEGHIEVDLRPWDVAAAGLVLQEAGGCLTTWSGKPVDWLHGSWKSTIAASNGAIHAELISLLAPR